MAAYTDAAFRLLSKEYGADYTVTEFVSSEGLTRESAKSRELTYISPRERPAAIQIFGSNPNTMAKAAQMLESECDVIDINFGCPAPSVTRACGGAALLKDPQKIKEIIEAISSTIKIPVTAKMRLGVTNIDNSIAIAKIIEKSGAQALTVHGRTLSQGYSGQANWEQIAKIKNELSIPVFGNGDVTSYEKAQAFMEKSKVDAVFIGRGALGNPFIFKHCKQQKDETVTPNQRVQAFMRYLEIRDELKLRADLTQIKAHATCFVRGAKEAAQYRLEISRAKSIKEINDITANWLNK